MRKCDGTVYIRNRNVDWHWLDTIDKNPERTGVGVIEWIGGFLMQLNSATFKVDIDWQDKDSTEAVLPPSRAK